MPLPGVDDEGPVEAVGETLQGIEGPRNVVGLEVIACCQNGLVDAGLVHLLDDLFRGPPLLHSLGDFGEEVRRVEVPVSELLGNHVDQAVEDLVFQSHCPLL